MNFLTKLFRTPTTAELADAQRKKAEMLALEHRASAEHHAALANMYNARAVRLAVNARPEK